MAEGGGTDQGGVRAYLFSIVPEWLVESPEVGPSAVRIFAALYRFANNKGAAWPSRATIAERACCSMPTLEKALKELVAVDALRINHRFNEGGKTSSLYTLWPMNDPDVDTKKLGAARRRLTKETGANPSLRKLGMNESQLEREPSLLSNDQVLDQAKGDFFSSAFDAIWTEYPRKESKQAAIRVLKKVLKDRALASDLLTATRAYAMSKHDSEPKFIKLASTFFGPDEHWREWLIPGATTTIREDDHDWDDEIQRRREESTAMPEHMKKNLRKQLGGAKT